MFGKSELSVTINEMRVWYSFSEDFISRFHICLAHLLCEYANYFVYGYNLVLQIYPELLSMMLKIISCLENYFNS